MKTPDIVYNKSFAAGVLLAILLATLAFLYKDMISPITDARNLALLLAFVGIYAGHYLGFALKDRDESSYFMVGMTMVLSAIVFILLLVSLDLVVAVLPIAIAFEVIFVNSKAMTSPKNYVKLVELAAKYLSQIIVATAILSKFVSPVTLNATGIVLDITISFIIAIIFTAANIILENRKK